jgi:excisionase family DNA binding protein
MTKDYNAIVELGVRADSTTEDQVDQLIEVLSHYAPAIGPSPRGWLEVTITLPAVNLEQATMTALAVVRAAAWAGVEPIASQVLTTDEFDARVGMTPLPSLIGTAEAAEILEVSQQRVVQLVNAGQLSATRAGRALALSRSEVEAFRQRDRPTGRPRAQA